MYLGKITFLVILSTLSTSLSMSIVPAIYQVTAKMASYLTNQHNSTPLLVQDHHFLTSPHYHRVTGVYNRLEEEEMNAPVYQKVDLITGRTGTAFLFRREGGKYRLLHNILR